MSSNNYIRDGMVAQILSNATTTADAVDMSFNNVYNYAIGTNVLDFPESNILRLPRDFDGYCPQTLVIHLHPGQNSYLSDTTYINTICNLFNNIHLVLNISGNPILQFPFSLLHALKPAVKYDNKIYLSIPFQQLFGKIDMNILHYSNIDFSIEHFHELSNYSHQFSLISKVYIQEETERHNTINNGYNGRKFIQQMSSLSITVPYNSTVSKRSFHLPTSLLFGQTKGFLIQGNIAELTSIKFYVNNILRFDYDPFLISTACAKVSDNLIYMPFNETTNFLDNNVNTFAGSINLSRLQSSSISLQFSSDQNKFTIHNIYSNYFCYRNGVGTLYLDGVPVFINTPANFLPLVEPINNTPTLLDMSGNYILSGRTATVITVTNNSVFSETGTVVNTEGTITEGTVAVDTDYYIPTGRQIYQLINPERNICNISHDEIVRGRLYMTCSNCNNNFLESNLKQWLRRHSGSSRTCPTCREIWSNYNVYFNVNDLE
jgi:hypothetical protein